MPTKITKIHDKFTKELLSDRMVAIDFFKEFLSPKLLDFIKIETLESQPTTYISENLKETFSDIVWRVETPRSSVQICLLLEHKSYKDSAVMFQIMEYLAQAYQLQLKNKVKNLELIVPILYYHGKEKWKPKTLEESFKKYPDFLIKYLPLFTTEYIDLGKLSTEQLLNLQNGMLASAMTIQRHYFDSQVIMDNFTNIIKTLEPYLEMNLGYSTFVYMMHSLNISEAIFNQKVEEIPNNLTDKIMSLYDQLIEKGIRRGIEEGRVAGIEEGIEQTILNAHAEGIDLNTIRIITGKSIEKIKDILKEKGRL